MRPDGRRRLWPAVRAALRAIAGPTLPLPPSIALCLCQACARDRIVVVAHSHYGDGLGVVHVRCADCGARRHIVATSREVDALVALHAEQRQAMADELAALEPSRMSEEIAALLGDS